MENKGENGQDQAASFLKMWLETMTKMNQVAFTITPNSPPPEAFRQYRDGVLKALSESWDQFLRSPQFLEATKHWMEQTVTLRKMGNEFLGKVRHEMQAPSRDDVDTIMLAVRHMEKRLLDRIDQLVGQSTELQRSVRPARSQRARTAKRPRRRGVQLASGAE